MTYCLIVDDNRISRQVLEFHVTHHGMESSTADDGMKALENCKTRMPDIILLDWHMPKMDGLTFLEELRKLPRGNQPHVIMCTC